jgi:hypothetical protein
MRNGEGDFSILNSSFSILFGRLPRETASGGMAAVMLL